MANPILGILIPTDPARVLAKAAEKLGAPAGSIVRDGVIELPAGASPRDVFRVPVPPSREEREWRVAMALAQKHSLQTQYVVRTTPPAEYFLQLARAAIAASEPSFAEPTSSHYIDPRMSDIIQGLERLFERQASHETKLDRVLSLLERLITMSNALDTDVAALTDAVTGLTTAISNEGSVVTAAVTEIQTLLANGAPDAAALTAITNATSVIATATANITNAGSTLASAIPAPIVNTGT